MILVERLRESPMFEEFTDENLKVLARSMKERTYKKGEVIIREGDAPTLTENAMFLILDGLVVVTTRPKGEADLGILHLMRPGEIVGLVALVSDSQRAATVRAGGDVKVATLTRTAFNVLFRSNMVVAGRFQYAVARQLARDVRACDAYLAGALQGKKKGDITERAAKI